MEQKSRLGLRMQGAGVRNPGLHAFKAPCFCGSDKWLVHLMVSLKPDKEHVVAAKEHAARPSGKGCVRTLLPTTAAGMLQHGHSCRHAAATCVPLQLLACCNTADWAAGAKQWFRQSMSPSTTKTQRTGLLTLKIKTGRQQGRSAAVAQEVCVCVCLYVCDCTSCAWTGPWSRKGVRVCMSMCMCAECAYK